MTSTPRIKERCSFKTKRLFSYWIKIAQESLSAKTPSLQRVISHYQNSANGTGCYKLWYILCGMPANLGALVKLSEANNSGNIESHFPKRLKIIQSPTQMLTRQPEPEHFSFGEFDHRSSLLLSLQPISLVCLKCMQRMSPLVSPV